MVDKVNKPCTKILRDWCKSCNISDIAYDFRVYDQTLVVYTSTLGAMIGHKSKILNKYKEMFLQEYGKEFSIKFCPIKGEFLHID